MTLQEAKDQIARENGFIDWDDYNNISAKGEKYNSQFDRAAELYAEQQVSEYSQAYQLRQSELVNELYTKLNEVDQENERLNKQLAENDDTILELQKKYDALVTYINQQKIVIDHPHGDSAAQYKVYKP